MGHKRSSLVKPDNEDNVESKGENPITEHDKFCDMIGMPQNYKDVPYPPRCKVFPRQEGQYRGLYPRVQHAYEKHTCQYWLIWTTSNVLLLLQICFGAALTALGGTKSDKISIAIIVLGALQTIFGGIITYFKSRNQPNRTYHLRNSLKKVLDEIEYSEEMLRDPCWKPPSYTPSRQNIHALDLKRSLEEPIPPLKGVQGLVRKLNDMYTDAIKDAEANYPDYWVTMSQIGTLIVRPIDGQNTRVTST